MSGDDSRKAMDTAMSELREKLRRTSEKLNATSSNITRLNSAAPPGANPAPVSVIPEKPAHYEPRTNNGVPVEDWTGHLRGLSARLETLSSETESEFLRVGSSLHDFRQRAQKISEMSEYVARLINDNDVEKTVVELNWALDIIKQWLAGLDDMQSAKRQRAEKVVERTEACLASLRKKHRISAAMARNFSSKSEEITRCIYAVVQSMQYHDITRQRVEHVGERLRDCISMLDTYVGGAAAGADIAGEAGGICRELSDALAEAEREFDRATKDITCNLRLVAKHAGVISAEIRTVTRGETETEKSFLSGMGNWISALAEILSGFSPDGAVPPEVSMMPQPLSVGVLPEGRQVPDGEDSRRPGLNQLIEMLNGMVKSMHRINGNVLHHLSLVDEAGTTLSADIDKTLGTLDVHDSFTSAMTYVRHGLDMVVRESRRVAPGHTRSRCGRAAEEPLPRTGTCDDIEFF